MGRGEFGLFKDEAQVAAFTSKLVVTLPKGTDAQYNTTRCSQTYLDLVVTPNRCSSFTVKFDVVDASLATRLKLINRAE